MIDLETLTIAEAEALFAEPLSDDPMAEDFCEPELIAVYRRHYAHPICDPEALGQRHQGAEGVGAGGAHQRQRQRRQLG